jgi:hypothetical protein
MSLRSQCVWLPTWRKDTLGVSFKCHHVKHSSVEMRNDLYWRRPTASFTLVVANFRTIVRNTNCSSETGELQ